VPRQLKENGLKLKEVRFSDKAILKIITEYTLEAGLRNLEREIGSVCRKVARRFAEGRKQPVLVSENRVAGFLGPARYLPEEELRESEIGVATGLAWTEVGGEILFVEVSTMKGKGELTLTGHLGEVMKESAQAALSYARAHALELGIDENFLDGLSVHVHVPAGAIPKDGPSAGVTMATALISALSGRRVNKDVAMTGEITLRGRVLPIGGLKEKVLAAVRAKIRTIIVPARNTKDLEDIPTNLRNKIRFIAVSTMDEVLREALEPSP
ncbi:MAG: magnesium chelatase domain-containing protein, partial [Desulfuromonadaceae bacterium]